MTVLVSPGWVCSFLWILLNREQQEEGGWGGVGWVVREGWKRERKHRSELRLQKEKKKGGGQRGRSQILKGWELTTTITTTALGLSCSAFHCDTHSHTVAEVTYNIAYFSAIIASILVFPVTWASLSQLSILRPHLSPRGSHKGTC